MSNVNSILIIGLGMIGSSIALSSKSKGLKVSGFDLDVSINDIALKDNIIDNSAESLEEINLVWLNDTLSPTEEFSKKKLLN